VRGRVVGQGSGIRADVVHVWAALACGQHVSSPMWRACAGYHISLETITKRCPEPRINLKVTPVQGRTKSLDTLCIYIAIIA
jgi:hypothetical protein